MPFISITRLRLRSVLYVPLFAIYASRSLSQVKRSPGYQKGKLLADRHWTFWTMTAWDNHESMRNYMTTGSHKAAMPHLMNWCNEASVVHWEEAQAELPSWEVADQRMRAEGRISKVRHPGPHHATMTYQPPRLTRGGPI